MLDHKESFWLGGNSFEDYKAVPKNLQRWFNFWTKRKTWKRHVMHNLLNHCTYLKGLKSDKVKMHKKMYYKCYELPKDLKSPMVIIIFSNKVAQILWGQQSFAFVLKSKKIKDSFMKYFNHFWKNP